MRSCEQTTCGAFNAISISFMSSSLHLLTQLELREMFQFRSWIGKKKKKHKQDAGALAGFSSDNPPPPPNPPEKRESERREGSKMLFQLWDVHQRVQMGTFRGNLGTSDRHHNTHHLYSKLVKKKKDQSFCR